MAGRRHGKRPAARVGLPVRRGSARVRGRLSGARSGPAAEPRSDVTVPVAMTDEGLAEADGVEAKAIILKQLASALEIIRQHNPTRIATLGGECSVSVGRSPRSLTGTATI